jgi:hypothetical protein
LARRPHDNRQHVFIEPARGEKADRLQATFVEDPANGNGMGCEVAVIEARGLKELHH